MFLRYKEKKCGDSKTNTEDNQASAEATKPWETRSMATETTNRATTASKDLADNRDMATTQMATWEDGRTLTI